MVEIGWNYLVSNKWNLITAFIAIMAIIVPVYVAYDLATANKVEAAKLEYQELAQTNLQLLLLDERIQMYADGKEIENLHLAIYSIMNNGGSPILPKDIFENISVRVLKNWEILGISNVSTTPRGINLVWKRENEVWYSLEPILINPGDSFTVAIYAVPKIPVPQPEDKVPYIWSTRVSSMAPFTEYIPSSFTLKFSSGIVVLLSGWELLFAITLAVILIAVMLALASSARVVPQLPLRGLLFIVFVSVVGFSVAEVVTYFLFEPIEGGSLDFLNWSILAFWAVLIVYLAILAYRGVRT